MTTFDDLSVTFDSLLTFFDGVSPRSADEIVVAATGTIWVALVGTTPPTDPTTTPPAGWVDLGFTTEDGATFRDAREIDDTRSWQSFYATRKLIVSKEASTTFSLQQWNEDTVPLAFGGGEVVNPTLGVWRYVPPEPDDIDERALMIDWQDGTKNYRLLFPRGLVTGAVEINLRRTDEAELPVTFVSTPNTGDAPFVLLTDDDAFG